MTSSVTRQSFSDVDVVAVDPRRARVHEAGWQTWSPTGTYRLDQRSPRPANATQEVMRFRPGGPPPQDGFQSEGVLVVDDGLGGPTRAFASRGGSGVTTLRAAWHGDRLVVSADGPAQVTPVDGDVEAALARFGDAYASAAGVGAVRPAPTVWCSWYHYYERATAADVVENLEAMEHLDLPVDVVQVDDAWQAGIGDWDAYSPAFADLPGLVRRIRDNGRRAGLWLAPLTVGSGSRLADRHPDWLVGDGGHNWGQTLHGLDVTHPDAAAYLVETLTSLRALGVDYLKLDFLYTGALPGRRHADATELDAYRRGLALVRQAVGPETYLVGCGAPLLPSVGLVDAMRVSADVLNPAAADPGVDHLRGEGGIRSRAWQHGRFWVNDPDCLIARPGYALREARADLLERWGGLRSASDRVVELDARGLELTRRLLSRVPPVSPLVRPGGGPDVSLETAGPTLHPPGGIP